MGIYQQVFGDEHLASSNLAFLCFLATATATTTTPPTCTNLACLGEALGIVHKECVQGNAIWQDNLTDMRPDQYLIEEEIEIKRGGYAGLFVFNSEKVLEENTAIFYKEDLWDMILYMFIYSMKHTFSKKACCFSKRKAPAAACTAVSNCWGYQPICK